MKLPGTVRRAGILQDNTQYDIYYDCIYKHHFIRSGNMFSVDYADLNECLAAIEGKNVEWLSNERSEG